MPKIEDLPSLGLKGVKGVKGVKKTESHLKDLNKLTEDKEFKMCNSALKKLEKMEGDQDEDEWVNFVERKGEDMIVKSLKARANISQVWKAVCGGDGNANIEMYEGIEFVLKHDFMPNSVEKTMNLAFKYPNLAFRVIADDTSSASLKLRALLAADHENENAFKLKMREWYDDHKIDVASQATFDYIGWNGE
jgi:hypothetical protein